jgi:hypothetical protein
MGLEAFSQDRKRVFIEAWKKISGGLEERKRVYERRMTTTSRTAPEYSVGDYVMVAEPVQVEKKRTPEKSSPKLRLHKSTGPWQVDQVVVPGRTYLVRMFGRRVRLKTVHHADLRPYHVRPEHLREDREGLVSPSAPVLSADELATLALQTQQPVQILERRRSGSGWLYQVRWLDGSVSDWLPEAQLLEHYSKMSLDCWHALYELYTPEQQQPDHARRGRRQKQYMTKEEALQKFPVSTLLTRWIHRDDEEETVPLTARITGYVRPYYRVVFEDGDWEELSLREVVAASRDHARLQGRQRSRERERG